MEREDGGLLMLGFFEVYILVLGFFEVLEKVREWVVVIFWFLYLIEGDSSVSF